MLCNSGAYTFTMPEIPESEPCGSYADRFVRLRHWPRRGSARGSSWTPTLRQCHYMKNLHPLQSRNFSFSWLPWWYSFVSFSRYWLCPRILGLYVVPFVIWFLRLYISKGAPQRECLKGTFPLFASDADSGKTLMLVSEFTIVELWGCEALLKWYAPTWRKSLHTFNDSILFWEYGLSIAFPLHREASCSTLFESGPWRWSIPELVNLTLLNRGRGDDPFLN